MAILESLRFEKGMEVPINRGAKAVTIRAGEKYEKFEGVKRILPLEFTNGTSSKEAIILAGEPRSDGSAQLPRYERISDVPIHLIYSDGFRSWQQALSGLKNFYPDLTEDSPVFPILFAQLSNLNYFGAPMNSMFGAPVDILKRSSLREVLWPSMAIGFLRNLANEERYVDVSDAFNLWGEFLMKSNLITSEEHKLGNKRLESLRGEIPTMNELVIMRELMERLINGRPIEGDRATIQELICLIEPSSALATPLEQRVRHRQKLADRQAIRRSRARSSK